MQLNFDNHSEARFGSFSTEAAYPAARPSSALRRKLTSGRNVKICRDGPNRTQAVQQKGFLFDDLVSELLEMRRHVEAKRICCL